MVHSLHLSHRFTNCEYFAVFIAAKILSLCPLMLHRIQRKSLEEIEFGFNPLLDVVVHTCSPSFGTLRQEDCLSLGSSRL